MINMMKIYMWILMFSERRGAGKDYSIVTREVQDCRMIKENNDERSVEIS